ncbi:MULTISPECIES: DUF1659 domain-containing protein [Bacillus]|uniref:DUF1659 domain-containing protein n=1 Tax=Bacillus TaxID=1386 RepID=UPI00031005F1|nr:MULTISPECIES: DUF1659 domain-containing protein [Bacillus]
MANETIVSQQLRLCFQEGFDTKGNPIIKRKSFTKIDESATTAQLIATANAIAVLQTLPMVKVEKQEIQALS